MVSLPSVAWPEVKFVSIEDTTIRVLLGENVHLFAFDSREQMEQELQKWFSAGQSAPEDVNLDLASALA